MKLRKDFKHPSKINQELLDLITEFDNKLNSPSFHQGHIPLLICIKEKAKELATKDVNEFGTVGNFWVENGRRIHYFKLDKGAVDVDVSEFE